MKPKTREQNFLAKIAGDTNADLTMVPRTAEEYFLNQIAESGGGLPSYTSADKGKVLTIGEASPVETEVVVFAEQTVEFSRGSSESDISSTVTFDTFAEGSTGTLTIDGTSYPLNWYNNGFRGDENAPTVRWYSGSSSWGIVSEEIADGNHTVSFTATASVTPSVQTVIVPEQEVTITDYGDEEVAIYCGYLSNFDFSSLVDGDEAVFNINGVEYLGGYLDGEVYFNVPDHGEYYVGSDGQFDWYESAVLTVSATASVAALEPKWSPLGGVYTLSSSAENTLLSILQSAIATAATGGSARVDITTGFDSDDVAMIEKMADDFSSGSPCVLPINAITNALSPVASSTSDTISNKFVVFNIPLYKASNMYFNIILTLNAGVNLFGTVTVIKLTIT